MYEVEGPFKEAHSEKNLDMTGRWLECMQYPSTAKNSKSPLKRDLQTSWLHALRAVARTMPHFVVAEGQPGMMITAITLHVLEGLFRYRAVELSEALKITESWLAIRAVLTRKTGPK